MEPKWQGCRICVLQALVSPLRLRTRTLAPHHSPRRAGGQAGRQAAREPGMGLPDYTLGSQRPPEAEFEAGSEPASLSPLRSFSRRGATLDGHVPKPPQVTGQVALYQTREEAWLCPLRGVALAPHLLAAAGSPDHPPPRNPAVSGSSWSAPSPSSATAKARASQGRSCSLWALGPCPSRPPLQGQSATRDSSCSRTGLRGPSPRFKHPAPGQLR